MTHREEKKEKKRQNTKHSRPEIITEDEIQKHKKKGTIDGTRWALLSSFFKMFLLEIY